MEATSELATLWSRAPPTVAVAAVALPVLCLVVYPLAALALRQKGEDARQRERKVSWILTATASVSMTGCSLPFVWDLLRSANLQTGLDVDRVASRPALAAFNTGVFMGYLAADILLSRVFYPRMFTVMTGWVHHTLYLFLLAYLGVWRDEWLKVFCTAGLLEFPTLLLAVQNLSSRAFNWSSTVRLLPRAPKLLVDVDLLFTTSFFLTRIVFHTLLIVLCASRYGQAALGGSIQPAVFLCCAMVLHVLWFKAAVLRLVRRRGRRAAAAVAEKETLKATAAAAAAKACPASPPASLRAPRAPFAVGMGSMGIARPMSPRALLRPMAGAPGSLPRSNRLQRIRSGAAAAARRFPVVGSRIEGLDTWHSLLVPEREDSFRRRVLSSLQQRAAGSVPAVPSILVPPRSESSSPERPNRAAAQVLLSLAGGEAGEDGKRYRVVPLAQTMPAKAMDLSGKHGSLSPEPRTGRSTARSTPVGSMKVRRSRHASPALA